MQHDVLQDFNKNPTKPKHRNRTEYGVLMNAQDAFDAAMELFGDKHTIQSCVWRSGFTTLYQQCKTLTHTCFIINVEQDTADF